MLIGEKKAELISVEYEKLIAAKKEEPSTDLQAEFSVDLGILIGRISQIAYGADLLKYLKRLSAYLVHYAMMREADSNIVFSIFLQNIETSLGDNSEKIFFMPTSEVIGNEVIFNRRICLGIRNFLRSYAPDHWDSGYIPSSQKKAGKVPRYKELQINKGFEVAVQNDVKAFYKKNEEQCMETNKETQENMQENESISDRYKRLANEYKELNEKNIKLRDEYGKLKNEISKIKVEYVEHVEEFTTITNAFSEFVNEKFKNDSEIAKLNKFVNEFGEFREEAIKIDDEVPKFMSSLIKIVNEFIEVASEDVKLKNEFVKTKGKLVELRNELAKFYNKHAKLRDECIKHSNEHAKLENERNRIDNN